MSLIWAKHQHQTLIVAKKVAGMQPVSHKEPHGPHYFSPLACSVHAWSKIRKQRGHRDTAWLGLWGCSLHVRMHASASCYALLGLSQTTCGSQNGAGHMEGNLAIWVVAARQIAICFMGVVLMHTLGQISTWGLELLKLRWKLQHYCPCMKRMRFGKSNAWGALRKISISGCRLAHFSIAGIKTPYLKLFAFLLAPDTTLVLQPSRPQWKLKLSSRKHLTKILSPLPTPTASTESFEVLHHKSRLVLNVFRQVFPGSNFLLATSF